MRDLTAALRSRRPYLSSTSSLPPGTDDARSQRAGSEMSFMMPPKKTQFENTYKMDPDVST